MFFDDEDERFHNPEIFRVVHREFSTYFGTNLEVIPYALRTVPTHTEDGIPIRKLYVSNLPPKTTRTELFGVFAQYGFIRSCWLRMGEKGPNHVLTPTYAFVTFSNPADAHKALQAPSHEKSLRGRNLRISPADSWHQPSEDSDGKVIWKPRYDRRFDPAGRNTSSATDQHVVPESSLENGEATNSEVNATLNGEESSDSEQNYTIMDILNSDCLNHILSYVPIRDLIRSERVSIRWQAMIQEYLEGIRLFKTSWWRQVPRRLTTAVLRTVLSRLGASLMRLHIDHPWSALNDRTAHIIGKFCPNLEELKIVSLHTKNWNPLVHGCKQLKSISFISCNKLTDSSLVNLVKSNSSIESLSVANNTHVTGLFLTGSNPLTLSSLAFYNCYSLQGTVLNAAIDTLPNLTTLKLDVCPLTMWKMIPQILEKLPKLEELSLSEYASCDTSMSQQANKVFCKSLANLKELKIVNFSRNIYINNAVLKQLAQSCPKIESLNVSSCNSRRGFGYSVFVTVGPHTVRAAPLNRSTSSTEAGGEAAAAATVAAGVGDDGVEAVCRACPALRALDVSYLGALRDAGLAAAAAAPALARLVARGLPALSAEPFAQCLARCHRLQEIDACGCDNVSEEVISAAVAALETHPRKLVLRLAGTATPPVEEHPTHKLLTVDVDDDTSNPNFRPDFVDRVFEDSSDDSIFDDLLEHDKFDDFMEDIDELFMDDDEDDLFIEH